MKTVVVTDQGRIPGLVVYPISGRRTDLFQPELLDGARAHTLLDEMGIKGAIFNTGLAIHN